MSQTGTYVSISRSKLGPDPDVPHRVRCVAPHGRHSVAICVCGWRSGRRRTPSIARESLAAHIAKAS